MLTSIVLLLVGLLAPGLSLPFPPGLQDTACKKDKSVAPEVRLLHSSRKPRDSDDSVMLTCRFVGFHSAEMDITWLENGESKPLFPNMERRWNDANGQNFSTTSTLYIPSNAWKRSDFFSCQVTRKPTSTNVKSQVRKKRTGASNPDIKVYTQRPNPEDLSLEKSAKFTCLMSKEKLAASWSQENPGTLTPKTPGVRTESKGAISQATASFTDGKGGGTFTCKVEPAQELAGPEGEKTG